MTPGTTSRTLGSCMLALALLAGCGPGEGGRASQAPTPTVALEGRAADAPRAGGEVGAPFALLRYRIDVSQESPRVCLTFSRPLAADVDWSAYVSRASGEALAFGLEGDSLCLGGFSFAASPRLTLRAGLPAADGQALAADEELQVEFGDRPAYVGFAGDGVILPRIDADGLAIETVNVAAVRVRILRVNDRALAFRSITQGFTAAAGRWAWLSRDENPEDVAEEVWRGEMDTAGPANAPVTTVLPLDATIGRLEPGAYFVALEDAAHDEARDEAPARARRWLVITDLAFTAYRSSDGLDLTLRSLHTAQPAEAVRVELIARNNERLGTAVSDASGRVRFDAPVLRGEGTLAPRYLFAYGSTGDFAVLDLDRGPVDLSVHDTGGRRRAGRVDGFPWLDRGIYRPGETVHASVMLRDPEGRAVTDRAGELRLRAPNGIVAAQQRFEAAPRAGTLNWSPALPKAAARGVWRLEAELDGLGAVASEGFSVEDFVPQRVALALDAETTLLAAGETRAIEVAARFLYGAPGAGLVVEGRTRVQRDPAPFPELEGFRFGRHDDPFAERILDLSPTVADGEGRAVLRLDPADEGSDFSIPLRLRTVVSVIEPGGRPVADDVRIPYRPRSHYLGLKPAFEGRLERQSASEIEVRSVAADGSPRETDLHWRLVRNDWDYDWYRSPGGRWQWRRESRRVPVEAGQVRTMAGAATLALPPLPWGEYELRMEAGTESAAVASLAFSVGWVSTRDGGDVAPDRVQLAGPEVPVSIGGEARLAIEAPYAGPAELVIASDRILHHQMLVVPEGGLELTVPVTEDWGAGAYAMINVFTPRDAVDRPLPRRAVGLAWVPVDTGPRELDLVLDVEPRIRPRGPLVVEVEVANAGEGAWVTLAAVDEGILALTRFASPDPVDFYFGKTALGVDLLDDYGRLLDPNQGAAAPVRSGGDMIGGAGLTVVPTRTVALFSGPVAIEDGRARIELDVPDFQGELRLMAVAWSEDRLGGARQPVTVRDRAVAELVLPRFLAPGDEAIATLSVDNVELSGGRFAVEVASAGAVEASLEASVALEAGERRDLAVPVRGETSGTGRFSLTVAGPDDFAVERAWPIEARSAWLPATRVDRRRLEAGERLELAADDYAAWHPGAVTAELSVSASPLDPLPMLASLRDYPWACSEQLTSRALPLLYADALGAGGNEASAAREARVAVQDAVATLLSRQSAEGAFGLWRVGDASATPWLGAYVVDFLARAQREGVTVPAAALDRALDALEDIAAGETWRLYGWDTEVVPWPWQDDTQERRAERAAAYAAWVLAREGRADRSRLRYLHDERLAAIASPLARAQIGAALATIGDRARAESALAAAEEALGQRVGTDYYQSPLRDLAGVLALAAEADQPERVARLADALQNALPDPDRMTTQEKAFALLAARALAGDGEAPEIELEGAIERLGPRRLQPDTAGEGAAVVNRGAAPLWVTHRIHGETVAAPPAVAERIGVDKAFYDLAGRGLGGGDVQELRRGDRIVIVLDLRPSERRTVPAIVVDLLPPGLEIEAVLTPEDAGSEGAYRWLGGVAWTDVAEARDDRFVAALDLEGGEPERLAYLVRAVTPGAFRAAGRRGRRHVPAGRVRPHRHRDAAHCALTVACSSRRWPCWRPSSRSSAFSRRRSRASRPGAW